MLKSRKIPIKIMSEKIQLYTIGFTQKTAQIFFETLINSEVKKVIDARLNNVSQLAGFAKQKDLPYFLKNLANIDYVHLLQLAPTKAILDTYKKNGGDWLTYEKEFMALMRDRQVESKFTPDFMHNSCLLCSEATPENCHRRLVAEYFQDQWGNVEIFHL